MAYLALGFALGEIGEDAIFGHLFSIFSGKNTSLSSSSGREGSVLNVLLDPAFPWFNQLVSIELPNF
jgi:hypothetical protein